MSEITINELSKEIKDAIEKLKNRPEIENVGVVTRVGDGIAWIYGLSNCGYNEMIDIETDKGGSVSAFAFNLGENEIGAVLIGSDVKVKAGANVKLSGKILEIPVGDELIGRIVDPMGNPLDGGPAIKTKTMSPVERNAPGVLARKSVNEPMMTGLVAIDAMVPVGRGQRELIIGDRQTGKTAIAIDTIINQKKYFDKDDKDKKLYCIYTAIGQKRSTVANIVRTLKEAGAMDYTVVVAATASDSAPL